jgi:hypothetical protein
VIGGGHVSLEGVNPSLTYRESQIHQRGIGGLDTPTREVASCEGSL